MKGENINMTLHAGCAINPEKYTFPDYCLFKD